MFLERPATLLKKRPYHRYFPVNFAKFLRRPFLTEHRRWNMFSTNMKTKMQANFALLSNRICLTRVKNKTKSKRCLVSETNIERFCCRKGEVLEYFKLLGMRYFYTNAGARRVQIYLRNNLVLVKLQFCTLQLYLI